MCDGGQGFLAAQGASTALSAVGAARDSEAKRESLQYSESIARQNKELADLQVIDALERGKEEADRNRRGNQNLKSSIKTALGSSGFRSDQGDAVDLLISADVIGLAERGIVLDNAEKEAYERRIDSSNFQADAELLSARADRENPLQAGFSTAISGGLSVASKWYGNKIKAGTTTTTTTKN